MFVIIIHSNTSIHLLNHFPIVGYLMTLNEGFFGSKRNNNTLDGDVFMNILVYASNASTIRKYFKQMLQKEPTQCHEGISRECSFKNFLGHTTSNGKIN